MIWDVKIEAVTKITDGDTIRARYSWDVEITPSFTGRIFSKNPKGEPMRLILVDTPEEGDEGYGDAGVHVYDWLDGIQLGRLRGEIVGEDNFGRDLVDLYEEGYRADTLSQYLLRECGWPMYKKR